MKDMMTRPGHSGLGSVVRRAAIGLLAALPAVARAGDPVFPRVPTTLEDFFMNGTQPDVMGTELEPIQPSGNCVYCHGYFTPEYGQPLEAEPYRNWAGSMMAQATRDPIFMACLTIANQDAGDSGDLCIRCHSPVGWLGGRSTPTDGSGLSNAFGDFDGVTCHFCHRLVNPEFDKTESPIEDVPIITDLLQAGLLPVNEGGGQYVFDPNDVRRGPFSDANWPFNPHGDFVNIIESPFHRSSDLCATCHDVSNPAFSKQPDGSYAPNTLGEPHPTLDKYDMFPIERTYSEWQQSQFAAGGVQLNGRFGGNHPTGIMESCQDCHMPDQIGPGCNFEEFDIHQDMPQHALNGGNTWVINAVNSLYDKWDTGLTEEIIADALARVTEMLELASDMVLSQDGNRLQVRIYNYTGHKLPSGYPEGRRMWINVQFFDAQDQLIAERGAYDTATAVLAADDTKVYEVKLGLDEDMATTAGLPAGPSFHFAINNVVMKDNRIPPIGFNNAGFEAVQAGPVAYTYADGQFWDETEYHIPMGTASAAVTVYYQTTSKEYIEFLRDENFTDDHGQTAYDQWELHGKSAPVAMDQSVIDFKAFVAADLDNDGSVDATDLALLLGSWGPCPACPADINGDGTVGAADLAFLLGSWG